MKKSRKILLGSIAMIAFILFTLLVRVIDVQAIGPGGSRVGFATVNGAFHSATGTHLWLYVVTDWLSILPFGVILAFAALGLVQLIRRKGLLRVDRSILVLGIFYVAVMAAYLLFEFAVVNYRPVLIEGRLEASYPSSTTLLVLAVMPTAAMQLQERLKNAIARRLLLSLIYAFTAFMVLSRLVSGVHWLTDIIAGAVLGVGLLLFYSAFAQKEGKNTETPPKS